MRVLVVLALVAFAAADRWEEPWVETEDGEEPYSEQLEDEQNSDTTRTRRDLRDEELRERYSYSCCDRPRIRREAEYEYIRVPRQVHQYEVHEFTDEVGSAPSPPYEEMLAASAEHYHRIYAAPGAPAPAYYSNPEVSGVPVGVRPVPIIQYAPVPRTIAIAEQPQKLVHVPSNHSPVNVHNVPSQNPNHHVNVHSQINHSVPQASPVHHVPNTPVNHQPVTHHQPSVVPNPIQFVSANPEGPISGPAGVQAEPQVLVARLADGDLLGSAAGHQHQHHHHHKHAHGHTAGGGASKHAGHHAAHGGKSIKGFDSHQHLDKGAKGHKSDEHHRKEYEEAAGKKKKHHDHADHKGGHKEEAHGNRGAHFDEKKGHKKGHKTKGYHNKYHKDEFHKEHKFYDDFHKSGEHHRFGKFHAKHASNESGKKKAHHVNAGHDFVERGKKGYSNKGHLDADHKGYKGKQGHEEHHESHKNHGKKGGSEGGKEWGHSKKN